MNFSCCRSFFFMFVSRSKFAQVRSQLFSPHLSSNSIHPETTKECVKYKKVHTTQRILWGFHVHFQNRSRERWTDEAKGVRENIFLYFHNPSLFDVGKLSADTQIGIMLMTCSREWGCVVRVRKRIDAESYLDFVSCLKKSWKNEVEIFSL